MSKLTLMDDTFHKGNHYGESNSCFAEGKDKLVQFLPWNSIFDLKTTSFLIVCIMLLSC